MTVSGVPVRRVDLGVIGRPRTIGIVGIVLDLFALLVALPPIEARTIYAPIAIGFLGMFCGVWALARGEKRLGWCVAVGAFLAIPAGAIATFSGLGNLETVVRVVGADRGDAALRDAAHLRRDRRPLLRAQRRRQHRARGDDADRRLLRDLGRRQDRELGGRARDRDAGRRPDGAPPRVLRDQPPRRPDRRRHRDQLPRGRDHRLPVHRHLRLDRHAVGHPGDPRRPPQLPRPHPADRQLPRGRVRPDEPDDLARARARRALVAVRVPDAGRPAPALGRRAPAGRRHGRDLGLQDALRRRHVLGDARGARRRVPLDRLRALVQPEHERGARLHRARGADLRQVEPVRRARRAPACSASRARSPSASRSTRPRRRTLLPGAPVRAHPDRGRRSDRPLDPAAQRLAARTSSSNARARGSLALGGARGGRVAGRDRRRAPLGRRLAPRRRVLVPGRRSCSGCWRSSRPGGRGSGSSGRSDGPGECGRRAGDGASASLGIAIGVAAGLALGFYALLAHFSA